MALVCMAFSHHKLRHVFFCSYVDDFFFRLKAPIFTIEDCKSGGLISDSVSIRDWKLEYLISCSLISLMYRCVEISLLVLQEWWRGFPHHLLHLHALLWNSRLPSRGGHWTIPGGWRNDHRRKNLPPPQG